MCAWMQFNLKCAVAAASPPPAGGPRGTVRTKMRWAVNKVSGGRWMLLGAWIGLAVGAARGEMTSARPRGTTLTVYDAGFALVHESRAAVLSRGTNTLRLDGVPLRLDPATVTCLPSGGAPGFQGLNQQFVCDAVSLAKLLHRCVGQELEVVTAMGRRRGTLAHAPGEGNNGPLVLQPADGGIAIYPEWHAIQELNLAGAEKTLQLQPALLWNVATAQDGPQTFRLLYRTAGISWSAAYALVMSEDHREAWLDARAGIRNESGGAFTDARVRLAVAGREPAEDTARGAAATRFAYGRSEPAAAGPDHGGQEVRLYEVPETLSLADGEERWVELRQAEHVPLNQFYVYDGVRFERYQHNRRSDWNYGTEFQTAVENHVEFSNSVSSGLGADLPPGVITIYRQGADGMLDAVGMQTLAGVPAEHSAYVVLGPARGLRGERERTGYNEVVPLHTYEESFEIRLENETAETCEIRTVEHLYRSADYEIIKADAEYLETAPQTIEFRPVLKPGAQRAIHYTVKYSW